MTEEIHDYMWAVRHRILDGTQKEDLCRRGHCKFALPCVDRQGLRFVPWSCECSGQPAYPPVKACPSYIYDETPKTEEDTKVFFNIKTEPMVTYEDVFGDKTKEETVYKPKPKPRKKKPTTKKTAKKR